MYYHVSPGNRFCISVQCSDFTLIQAAIWRAWFRIQTVIELKKSVYMLEVLVIEARRINRHITLIFYRSVILGKTFYLHKDSLYDQVYTQTPANSMLILDEELRDKTTIDQHLHSASRKKNLNLIAQVLSRHNILRTVLIYPLTVRQSCLGTRLSNSSRN